MKVSVFATHIYISTNWMLFLHKLETKSNQMPMRSFYVLLMVFGDAVNTLLLMLVDHAVGHALEPVVLKNKGTKY